MRKHGITILLVLMCLAGIRPLIMADSPANPNWEVLFSEILPGTTESGSEEYIELYNPSDQPIDLTNWKIEYLSASADNWEKPTRTIPLNGIISPRSYLLAASTAYNPELTAIRYSSTLSQTGGHLRLVSVDNDLSVIQDLMAWGAAKLGLGDAVLAPQAGVSMNRFKNDEELIEPKLNNIDDFVASSVLTPLEDNLLPEPVLPPPLIEPETETQSPPGTSSEQESQQLPAVYYPIEISELFPNPAEPLSDAADEFVELYNPYNFRVELNNYRLQAGVNGTYKHTFLEEDFIEPGQYKILLSKDSSLTLSNTSGKVALFSPAGELLSQTPQYNSAPEGQSWILSDGTWQWTASVTAGLPNQFSPPPAVKSAVKKAAVSKTKTTKAKSSTAKTKPKVSGSSATKDEPQPNNYLEEVAGPVNPLVLAGTASLVVLYACYEYRKDFANKLRQLRSYRANRRANRINPASAASN